MLEDDENSGAEMDTSNVDLLEQLINLKINDDDEEDDGSHNETSESKTSKILSKSNAVFDFAKCSSKVTFFKYLFDNFLSYSFLIASDTNNYRNFTN